MPRVRHGVSLLCCIVVNQLAAVRCPPSPALPPTSLRPVYFPSADEGWLDWAAGLTGLHKLRLTAALLRIQPEEGLACLAPLARHLRALRLDGCVQLTDAGVPLLAWLWYVLGMLG